MHTNSFSEQYKTKKYNKGVIKLEKLVLDYIIQNKLIEENDKILVAVTSGGPDSMCLLNILYNLKETLKIELYT